MRLSLKLHPDSRCPAVTSLTVDVTRAGPALSLRYELAGDLNALALPAQTLPMRTDELWRHTCFEAFARPGQGDAYYEFNFAPSTQWAAYHFSGYRDGMSVAHETGFPEISVERAEGRLALNATVIVRREGPWRLGLSAVIEDVAGEKSYWALAHPPGKPDFHHADAFAAMLDSA